MYTNDQALIRRLADYERISGIFWIILSIFQIYFVWTAIAGMWNIFAGVTRIRVAKLMRQRDPTIAAACEGIAQLIIIGIVNLLVGGVIGILFVAFDFYIRDKVLTNAHVFTGQQATSGPSSVSLPLTAARPDVADFEQHLGTLAKLRDDGVISEEDFGQKKKQILGL
jgi:hypothetical protein